MESSSSDTGAHVPLLAQYYGRPPSSKSLPWKGSLSFFSCSTLARVVLLGLMWALLLSWIALLILFPTQFFRQRIETQVSTLLTSPFFRITGYSVILYALPLFLIAILGTIYLQLRPEKLSRGKDLHFSNILSSTSPILANKFLGIITSAELIFLLAVVLYAAWCLWSFLSQDLSEIGTIARDERWRYGLAIAGDRAGEIGLIFLGLLFLPVARGSVLLRLIDVPFEHAVKYHIWLGHLMMVIFTFHGLAFVLVWASEGRLFSRLTSWGSYEIANLPGVIALLAGWAIWVTSLPPVRPRFFELFFYTHQLYAIFIIFMALHAADFILGLVVASIFFFLLDRFLRFCQSRKTVGLLSARVLPCGTIELVLEKPPSLKYHALSFIFLNTPKLSLLQWHPFSVSSSPFDGNSHLAVLIKPLGCWTRELQGAVTALEGQDQKRDGLPFKLYMGVEGPYGDESDFYLRYNKLLLVAGGIGASPFVAILRDLLHRYEHSVENDLPQEVLLVWAVKKSKELHILDLVNPPSICLNYKTRFHLDVQAYVTQESHADFELQDRCIDAATIDACMSTDRPMSEVVGTGSNYWFCMCLIVAMIGYVITAGIFGCYLVTPIVGGGSDYSSPFWVRGGYVALAMVAAIIVFGGAVVGVWSMSTSGKARQSQRRVSDETKPVHSFNGLHAHDGRSAQVLQPQNIHYGVRPDFKVLFEDICKKWAGSNVGVLVCGPQSLQVSVALECRRINHRHLNDKKAALHFHSLSFDL